MYFNTPMEVLISDPYPMKFGKKYHHGNYRHYQINLVNPRISLAGESLVTILKTKWAWLNGRTPDGQPKDPKTDGFRQLTVILIALICCWLSASFFNGQFDPFTSIKFGNSSFPPVLLGLLASSGSAFCTSLLGYTQSVGNIKKEQLQQERMNTKRK